MSLSCQRKVSYIYIYTYLLTPWSIVLLEKLTGSAANQEVPRILWNPKVHYRTHKEMKVLVCNGYHKLPTQIKVVHLLFFYSSLDSCVLQTRTGDQEGKARKDLKGDGCEWLDCDIPWSVCRNLVINPLKTKRRLLYLKTQFVSRNKHFSSRL